MNTPRTLGLLLLATAQACLPDTWITVSPRDAGGADVGADGGADGGASCACAPGQMCCDDGCAAGPRSVYDGEGNADDGAGERPAALAEVDYDAGHSGLAFSFGGSDFAHYVELPSAVANFGRGGFTVSLWFRSAAVFNQSMIARRSACAGGPAFAGFDVRLGYTGRIFVELWTTGGQYVLTSPEGFNDGRWHHMALLRVGDEARLAVDGRVESVSPLVGSMDDPSRTPVYLGVGPCVVGAPGGNGRRDETRWFDGLLDEVAFFPRALDPREIAAIAAGRCAR